MKKMTSLTIAILLILPAPLFAWNWQDMWLTPDQQGAKLLREGKAQQAAQVFKHKDWRSVANYRAGNYVQAYQAFQTQMSSDGQYNAGNAAAFMQQYEKALAAYDKAIAINPNNKDAIFNREIIKKLLQKQKQQPQSKNNNQNQNNKNSQSSQQNSAQNNRPQQQDDKQQSDKQKAGNDKQQNKQNPQNSPPNQANNSQQNNNAGNEKQNAKPNEQTAATNNVQAKDEGKRQLLRRVADDPGGLLKQKFLRDYLRRHSIEQSAAQGDS